MTTDKKGEEMTKSKLLTENCEAAGKLLSALLKEKCEAADKLLVALLTEKYEAVDELVTATLRTARYLLRNENPNDYSAIAGVLDHLTETVYSKLRDARFSDHPCRSVPIGLNEEVDNALRKLQSRMLSLHRDGHSSEQTKHYLEGVAEATAQMLYSTIPLLLESKVVNSCTDLDKEEWPDFIA
jgi:hypothetical protein